MPRLLLSGIKLMAALSLLYFSWVKSLPIILFVCFGWCAWVWVVGRRRKSKVLSLAGFALMSLGWWCLFALWSYFAEKGDASHFNEARDYWRYLSGTSVQMGIALSLLGIVLLTWADYLIPAKTKPVPELPTEVKLDQSGVWPPAPKPPLG